MYWVTQNMLNAQVGPRIIILQCVAYRPGIFLFQKVLGYVCLCFSTVGLTICILFWTTAKFSISLAPFLTRLLRKLACCTFSGSDQRALMICMLRHLKKDYTLSSSPRPQGLPENTVSQNCTLKWCFGRETWRPLSALLLCITSKYKSPESTWTSTALILGNEVDPYMKLQPV